MLLRGGFFSFTFPSRLFLIAAVGAGGAAEEDAEATVGSPHPAGASPGAVSWGAERAGDSHTVPRPQLWWHGRPRLSSSSH